MHEPARLLARDPALARDGDAAVERDRRLVGDERAPERRPGAPRLVLAARLEAVDQLGLDALLAQPRETAARLRVRIERPGDDAGDPGGEHGVDAGRRRPVVGAGLHRHVERRAAGLLARRRERDDLAVAPVRLGRALADDRPSATTTRPDRRLRIRPAVGFRCELQRPLKAHASACTSRR